MKSLELQPTKENIYTTLIEDSIGRTNDVFRFASFLDKIEGNYSIAIDSHWGSGKTFFVRQVKMVLDTYNSYVKSELIDEEKDAIRKRAKQSYGRSKIDFDIQPMVSIYYDAWANDNASDPILSLVYEIAKGLEMDFHFDAEMDFYDIANKAASIMDLFTGRDSKALVEAFHSENPLEQIKRQSNLHNQISEYLETVIEERGNRIVIFVDELDRCRPSFAIQLLERIKHYFTNDRVTFVFSVNCEALQYTIRKFYGEEFDASRYLDRFFDISMALPPINTEDFLRFIGESNSYFVFDTLRSTIVKKYRFEMREILRYYFITSVATQKRAKSINRWGGGEENALDFCRIIILPIVIALKMIDYTKYSKFIHGDDSSPLLDLVNEDVGGGMWSQLLAAGECFEWQSREKQKTVSLRDKLSEVYEALFIKQYDIYHDRWVEIGQMTFDESVHNDFLKIISAISPEADYII